MELNRAVEYALLLEHFTPASKVGVFPDQHRESLMVDQLHLQPLGRVRSRQPHYLDRHRRDPVSLVANWNLPIPAIAVGRSRAGVA